MDLNCPICYREIDRLIVTQLKSPAFCPHCKKYYPATDFLLSDVTGLPCALQPEKPADTRVINDKTDVVIL